MKPRVTQTPKVFYHVTSAWPEHLLTAQQTLGRSADLQSIVFGTQNACGILPLSPCEERAGREPERGEIDKKRLLSPALSSFFEEERERKCGSTLKANLLQSATCL